VVLNQPCYVKYGNTSPKVTFIRYTNIVSRIKDAEIAVFSTYVEKSDDLTKAINKVKQVKKSIKIVIDTTTEIFATGMVNELVALTNTDNITIYTNSLQDEQTRYSLHNRGIKLVERDYFLEYMHYYSPAKLSPKVPFKHFLLLTGKPKIERAVFLKMLLDNDLLKYGHVSYFGIQKKNSFTKEALFYSDMNSKYDEYYRENIDQVTEFNNTFTEDLLVDIPTFNYDISHSRVYNNVPYTSVDFVIVFESDLFTDTIFHTEKPIKPIQLNKKFILIGNKGTLASLKRKVLDLYGRDISPLTDWVNIHYDSIEDINEKLKFIIEEIKQKIIPTYI